MCSGELKADAGAQKENEARRAHRSHARAIEVAALPLRCAVLKSTWVEWARERRRRQKPDERPREKQGGGAMRLESRARATTNLSAKSERARVWGA